MKLSGNSYMYILIIISMLFVVGCSLFAMKGLESRLMPLLFGGITCILATLGLVNEILDGRKQKIRATVVEDSRGEQDRDEWHGNLINLAWLAGFILGIYLFGFVIGAALFLLSYMKRLGAKWRVAVIFALLVPTIIYVGFQVALHIDLYRGLFLEWLLV